MEDNTNLMHCGDCLTKLPIFSSLTSEQFELVNNARCRVKFRPGETIFKQGTAMTHITIVNEGLVKVYIEGINNRNLILRFARPITIIGGPGFFTDFKNHITTMAVEETMACFIDVNTLTELIKENKDFALNLFKWVNHHTLLNYYKFIELTQKGMHGRIAGALLYLHNEIFNNGHEGIRINRQDLADLTAMSKESAIRILKEFKDENTITVDGNLIILNNIPKLIDIGQKG
jgi:CRP/FNR family transcriptional regulator, polysaccharide utilization system transcription regulator